MKRLSHPLPYLAALLIVFTGCAKSDTSSTAPTPTVLKITAVDYAGVPVQGATVSLYTSQTAFFSESGAVASQTTDASGVATFTGLSPVQYWFMVKLACENNSNSVNYTTSAIPTGTTTSVSTTLNTTGTLRFVNSSSNPYQIYINGVDAGTMNGGKTVNFYYELTGNYTLRVVQQSGYAISPTDETYTGTLGCGGTLVTMFP